MLKRGKWKELVPGVEYYEKPAYKRSGPDKHAFALNIDKARGDYKPRGRLRGVVREITKREGSVYRPGGFLDKSKLIIVESKDGLVWKKIKDLKIEGIDKIVEDLGYEDYFFIGLEDPDILTDEKGIKHVYFTIPLRHKYRKRRKHLIILGHAQGKTLNNLMATKPVIGKLNGGIVGFKEIAVSPIKYKGTRINLAEIRIYHPTRQRKIAIAALKSKNMAGPWKYLRIVADPTKVKTKWCHGELSPCTFLPKDFLSYGKYLVGIINGRSPKKESKRKTYIW